MIEEKSIFDEVRNNIGLVCDKGCVGADLAAVTELAISKKMKSICVMPNQVKDVWPWLEKHKVKIISRFYLDSDISDDFISDLSVKISETFRDGADGVVVFAQNKTDLRKFAAEILTVRDDLFFNKSFGVGIDIEKIDAFDWDGLFGVLQLLKADFFVLTFNNDNGNKSDFVGRIFAMLNASRGGWNGVVNFYLGQNIVRVDQVYRLIQKIKPETISKTEFLIDDNI